jgi:hypothetical protein
VLRVARRSQHRLREGWLLDPDGLTKAFRDSIKIKQTDGTLTSFGPLSAIGVVGVLSAIAVPNFIKYQCRAKQAEAKANLGGVRVAYRAFL